MCLEIELHINVCLQSFSISYISLSFFFFPLQGNLSFLIFGIYNFLNQGKYYIWMLSVLKFIIDIDIEQPINTCS